MEVSCILFPEIGMDRFEPNVPYQLEDLVSKIHELDSCNL